jgi:uncharacterized protein (TIGR03435 family)
LALLATFAVPGWCQQFEVTSVKVGERPLPGTANAGGKLQNPAWYSARYSTLGQLIRKAYELEDYQLSGGPPWLETERFDVDGRAASATTPDQILLMVRALLADRFELKSHFETKSILANVLTVAPDGPKIGPKFHPTADSGSDIANLKSTPDAIAFPALTMRRFSQYLRLNMTQDPETKKPIDIRDIPPVLDQTGLKGTYDIVLNANTHEPWPTVVERQFGLKLETRKEPIQVLIVDSASKPTVN